jgi:acyl-CoA synthetase (AMP-forming)/AMP-acid ligase II
MKSTNAVLDAWRDTLLRARNTSAILDPDGKVLRTFNDIEECACKFEDDLEIFSPGRVIAIQIGNHEDWPSLLIACLRSQLVVLPLEESISGQQRDAALRLCNATALVSALPIEAAPKISPLRTTDTTATWDRQPSILKLTSGTTGAPRAILFGSQQLLADCNQICDTMGISDADLNFGVIPVSHSYGFSNLLTPLVVRGVPMVISRDRTPRAVLTDLARTKATVFPGTPIFYQTFCDMPDIPALPQLRLCISAGAPLSGTVGKKFFEKFKLLIHSFYGASECGGICYDRDGRAFEDGVVGKPLTNVDVRINEPAAPSSQIRVRSAAVGDGYFPEPDEEKLAKGSFVPDDLLARTERGFKIVGRISDVINIAGKKLNPSEVEAHIMGFPGIKQAVVFGRPAATGALRNEEVAACVVADVDLRESNLLELCRKALSPWQVPKRIFIVDTIPTNERGKISRRDLARRFSANQTSSSLPTLGA